MKLYNKIKWVLGILMIFILIMATNLIDRSNFQRVKDSAVTIYEDRLVAKDLIFKMSNFVHEIELAAQVNDTVFFTSRNLKVLNEINALSTTFESTKMTTAEGIVFDELKANLKELKKIDLAYVENELVDNRSLLNITSLIETNLSALSQIQMSEGRKQMDLTKRAVDMVELFTQLEIYILIFLAIVIQVIVIYNPKKEDEKELK